jgi:hypothetical protein
MLLRRPKSRQPGARVGSPDEEAVRQANDSLHHYKVREWLNGTFLSLSILCVVGLTTAAGVLALTSTASRIVVGALGLAATAVESLARGLRFERNHSRAASMRALAHGHLRLFQVEAKPYDDPRTRAQTLVSVIVASDIAEAADQAKAVATEAALDKLAKGTNSGQ